MTYWNSLRLVSSVQRFILICVCTLALCLFVSKFASAFEYPVPPDEVRAAYYLGQSSDHEKLDAFLKEYAHHFAYPASNPLGYVEVVEFRTPYEQIALRSKSNHRETPLEADDAYEKNPGLVEVGVKIAYKPNYAGPISSLEGFKFSVSQERTIEPKGAPTVSICNPTGDPCTTFQMNVVLRFDARQFGQKFTTITIQNPEGQTFQTQFNLARLK